MDDSTSSSLYETILDYVATQLETCEHGPKSAPMTAPPSLKSLGAEADSTGPKASTKIEVLPPHESEPVKEKAKQEGLPKTISNYAETHCVICEAGMKVVDTSGHSRIFCLVCRDWMTDRKGASRITDCDRFEEREEGSSF